MGRRAGLIRQFVMFRTVPDWKLHGNGQTIVQSGTHSIVGRATRA